MKHKIYTITIKLLSFLPTIFLLFLIFGFSAQDGEASGSLSFEVSLLLVKIFSPFLPASTTELALYSYAESIHYFVRKAAHMTEYALLAMSLQLPAFTCLKNKLTFPKRLVIGFFLTVALAAADEYHQTFVPGRSGNLTDVCIDSVGILAGTLFLFLVNFLRSCFSGAH